MSTLREKQLMDEIALLRELVGVGRKEPRRDLVKAVFNNIYLGERPGQRGVLIPLKMPQSPDGYECGKAYSVPRSQLAFPWWKEADE